MLTFSAASPGWLAVPVRGRSWRVADWDGTHVLISQTTGRQKYKNIQRQPVIAFSITDPENPYRYLEIRGEVAAVDEDGSDAFINSLAKKYLGVYPWAQPGDHRVIVRVRPLHATSM